MMTKYWFHLRHDITDTFGAELTGWVFAFSEQDAQQRAREGLLRMGQNPSNITINIYQDLEDNYNG